MPIQHRKYSPRSVPLLSLNTILLLLLIAVISVFSPFGSAPPLAHGTPQAMRVERVSDATPTERNQIRLNDNRCLDRKDIKVTGGEDFTRIYYNTSLLPEQSGEGVEYIINLRNDNPENARGMRVEATYKDVGVNPQNGRSIGCVLVFSDFILCGKNYRDAVVAQKGLPKYYSNVRSECETPNIRISTALKGGFWLCMVEHARVDIKFFYDGNPEDVVDLSHAFLTIDSLDMDGDVNYPGNSPYIGNEAVKPANRYDAILLAESSKVERWGNLRGTSNTDYESSTSQASSYYYQRNPTLPGTDRSKLCVTMKGVNDGSNTFSFDIIDTQGYSHNRPFFGTIGVTELPAPTESVDSPGPYSLGDTVTWRIRQEVPHRDEMVGAYNSLEITDNLPEELKAKRITLVRTDDSREHSLGRASGVNTNRVSYQFDMTRANENEIYGYTHELVIEAEVVGYPSDGNLTLKNKAASSCNGGAARESNEVSITITKPGITLTKRVAESSIQNDDYDDTEASQRQEFRVGDMIRYSVTLSNNNAEPIAGQITVRDTTMPAGLELVGSPQVEGTHNQCELVTDGPAGTWGWTLRIDRLSAETPITVNWNVRPQSRINGWEIFDRAEAWIGDQRDGNNVVSENPGIWINSPELQVEKRFRQIDSPRSPDEPLHYEVELRELATPGTVARRTVLEDAFTGPGAYTLPDDFVLNDSQGALDVEGGSAHPRRSSRNVNPVRLHHGEDSKHWSISMEEVYGNKGYWVNSSPYTKWDAGRAQVQDRPNPLNISSPHTLKVSYDAYVDADQMKSTTLGNTATANAEEAESTETLLETTVETSTAPPPNGLDDETLGQLSGPPEPEAETELPLKPIAPMTQIETPDSLDSLRESSKKGDIERPDNLAQTGDAVMGFLLKNWPGVLGVVGGCLLLVIAIPLKRYLVARKRWYPF